MAPYYIILLATLFTQYYDYFLMPLVFFQSLIIMGILYTGIWLYYDLFCLTM